MAGGNVDSLRERDPGPPATADRAPDPAKVAAIQRRINAPPDYAWPALATRISLAAGAYVWALEVGLIAIGLVGWVRGGPPRSAAEFTEAVLALLAMFTCIAPLAFMVTLLVCGPVLVIVWSATRLMGVRGSWPAVGAVSGALVAFAVFAAPSYQLVQTLGTSTFPAMAGDQVVQLATILLLGPVMALFFGQTGGLYGGLVIQRQLELAKMQAPATESERLGFSVRQLMGLTVVASVLFAALRGAGLLGGASLAVAGCWILGAAVLSHPAGLAARRLLARFGPRVFLTAPATPTSHASR